MEEYLRFLQVERGLGALSVEAYATDLRQFAAHLLPGGRGPAQATREDIAAFLAAQAARGASPRSRSRKLSSLRGFFRWLLRSGHVAADPSEHISTPGGWKVLPKALPESRVAEVLAEAEGRAGGRSDLEQPALAQAEAARDSAMLELLYAGGLRASELTSLSVASLNLAALQLRVVGKRDKERVVPIGRTCSLAMERYLREARPLLCAPAPREARLFVSRKGRPLSRQFVWQLVKRATGGAASPHALRHSCATHMVDHGADLRSVQTVLGHADIATTEVYTHVALGRLRAVHRAFHPREQRLRPQERTEE